MSLFISSASLLGLPARRAVETAKDSGFDGIEIFITPGAVKKIPLYRKYAEKAGFDPNAMVSFFEKLLQERPEGIEEKMLAWQQTHPLTTERIAKAKEEIANLPDVKFCPECGRTYGRDAQFCEKDRTPLKMKAWAEHKT